MLNKAGVAPRTAQAAMRHSDMRLTMQTYTDPKLLDVYGALETLPSLSLNASEADRERDQATGTNNATAFTFEKSRQEFASKFAPGFAPTPDNLRKSLSFPVNPFTDSPSSDMAAQLVATSYPVNEKKLTDNCCQ